MPEGSKVALVLKQNVPNGSIDPKGKFLSNPKVTDLEEYDNGLREMIFNEFELIGSLDCPNILKMHEVNL